jgi:hypothetical protein
LSKMATSLKSTPNAANPGFSTSHTAPSAHGTGRRLPVSNALGGTVI